MSVERDAEQRHGGEEEYSDNLLCLICLLCVFFGKVDSGNDGAEKQYQVYVESCIERQSEHVHEQKLEPSAHLYHSRYDTVEHGCDKHCRYYKCQYSVFAVLVRELLVVHHQHDGWDTEEVKKVYTNREAYKVSYENEPAVAVG